MPFWDSRDVNKQRISADLDFSLSSCNFWRASSVFLAEPDFHTVRRGLPVCETIILVGPAHLVVTKDSDREQLGWWLHSVGVSIAVHVNFHRPASAWATTAILQQLGHPTLLDHLQKSARKAVRFRGRGRGRGRSAPFGWPFANGKVMVRKDQPRKRCQQQS
ncbi:uncharacterized protein B0I36DRAFT_346213 [Microdochium trichocladiopsis]|uniref:Uncharacterized protein n=1 Tax=Microdochium trichocladiopsis TaxID=1682393 RepID=A0A9P8YFC9_9PEZI|nr:uncharacterized protein B0I36DRAFT_346213 [Microdochium trichocladiopsis]KAH7038209.1 hypothetical protein B0I36DRAFT_346213 [Microdochium trichocladiopsis]